MEKEEWESFSKAMKEQSYRRRNHNKESSTELLNRYNIHFDRKNNGVHLVVKMYDKIWDFWPSTGKYKRRDFDRYNRGVRNLLREINSFKE